ncbi:hypothetical protein PCE1_002364 [Barthelona sp. PCE]
MNPTEVLLSISEEQRALTVWDARLLSKRKIIQLDGSPIAHTLCLIAPNHFCYADLNGPFIHMYDWSSSTRCFRSSLPAGGSETADMATVLCASSTGDYLFVGTSNGNVHCYELTTGTLFRTYNVHFDAITTLSFAEHQRLLAVGSKGGVVKLLDFVSNQKSRKHRPITITANTAAITGLYISVSAQTPILVVTSGDCSVRLYHIVNNSAQLSYCVYTASPISALAVSQMDHVAAMGTVAGQLYVLDLTIKPTAVNLSPKSNNLGKISSLYMAHNAATIVVSFASRSEASIFDLTGCLIGTFNAAHDAGTEFSIKALYARSSIAEGLFSSEAVRKVPPFRSVITIPRFEIEMEYVENDELLEEQSASLSQELMKDVSRAFDGDLRDCTEDSDVRYWRNLAMSLYAKQASEFQDSLQ